MKLNTFSFFFFYLCPNGSFLVLVKIGGTLFGITNILTKQEKKTSWCFVYYTEKSSTFK